MAVWQGVARTNYFRVKDKDAFLKMVGDFGNLHLKWVDSIHFDNSEPWQYVAIISDDGYWPDYRYNHDIESPELDNQIDFPKEVAKHLAENEVAIFTGAGFEGGRYVTGESLAINAKGEDLYINLNDIYQMVKNAWGIDTTRAEY